MVLKEKYESQHDFLKSFFFCQTRNHMLVNKPVNKNDMRDIIILISFHHSTVLLCISIAFTLFHFCLPLVCVFHFLAPISTLP